MFLFIQIHLILALIHGHIFAMDKIFFYNAISFELRPELSRFLPGPHLLGFWLRACHAFSIWRIFFGRFISRIILFNNLRGRIKANFRKMFLCEIFLNLLYLIQVMSYRFLIHFFKLVFYIGYFFSRYTNSLFFQNLESGSGSALSINRDLKYFSIMNTKVYNSFT